MTRIAAVLAAVLIFCAAPAAFADTLAQNTGGASQTNLPYYLEQSFTVVGTGNYNNITFNFYSPAGAPVALGTGYLFSSLYNLPPANLGPTNAGYLGSIAASGNEYTFTPSIILTAGQQYFFVSDYLWPTGSVAGGDIYSGGSAYGTTGSLSGYVPDPNGQSTDFLVTGTRLNPTPEPSSLFLLGSAALGVAGIVRRRFS